MLKILSASVAAWIAITGVAQAATVTVKIHGVASAKGNVLVSLCDEKTFLKVCPHAAITKAARGDVVVRFTNISPGRYAAASFHDENGDNKLGVSKLGVPTEGTGLSRNAVGRSGPPLFSDAAVSVGKSDAVIDVTLNYY